MSIESISLRTLLCHFGMTAEKRTAAVRADARAEIRKRQSGSSGGGDFHTPFWADAKAHAAGEKNLQSRSTSRVEANHRRDRLYPLLTAGFLDWWQNKRRWINEPIDVLPSPVKAPYRFVELGGTVKVDNILALRVGFEGTRLIYPYFSETPVLSPEVARLGLWLMSQALTGYRLEDMRILDVLRGQPFSIDRYPLTGNEGTIFTERYGRMLADWRVFIARFEREA